MSTFHDMSRVFCPSDIESSNHLFFSCHFSYNVWSAINNRTDIQGVNYNEGVQHLFMHANLVLHRRLKRTRFLIWVAVVWCLWLAWNKVNFQEGVADCNSIISQI